MQKDENYVSSWRPAREQERLAGHLRAAGWQPQLANREDGRYTGPVIANLDQSAFCCARFGHAKGNATPA